MCSLATNPYYCRTITHLFFVSQPSSPMTMPWENFSGALLFFMYAVYVGRAVVPSRGRPMSQQATKRASKLLLAWGYMVLN